MPFSSNSHLTKSGREPAVLEVVIHAAVFLFAVWNNKPDLSVHVASQELCDVRMQVDFSLCSGGLQVSHDCEDNP